MSTPSDQMPPTPPPVPEPEPSPPGGEAQGPDDRNIAMLTHLSGLLLCIIVPLVVWLLYKERGDKSYLVSEAREALNFQITVLIGYVICWILAFILIGAVLAWLLWIVNLIFCVWAAVSVSNTGSFRYPFALRLVN